MLSDNMVKRRRRCFHRCISGLERGGNFRIMTLTSSPSAPRDIQHSWRLLYWRLKRRNMLRGYIKVPEYNKRGDLLHLHVIFRGSFIAQSYLSQLWSEIHNSEVVWIEKYKEKGKRKGKYIKGSPEQIKRWTANYMAKYMCKESAGRYSWSWGWVWKGFCKHWTLYKRWWWNNLFVEGKTDFSNLLTGWKFWLKGIYHLNITAMELNFPPSLVFVKVKYASNFFNPLPTVQNPA